MPPDRAGRSGRPLTMKMAWRLHEAFGIPAEALIRPYDLAR